MSSHHIVREKQEPALLIMNIAQFQPEQLGQLLEWSPTVLVNAELYDAIHSLGIKIDGIIGREDSELELQPGTFIIPTNNKPLEDGLRFLCGEQYHAVNVIAGEFCLKDYAHFAERINLVIYSGNKRIFPVRSGFSKWKVANERIAILSEVKNLHVGGLRREDAHTFITEKEGFYTLSFDQAFIFVAEDL